MNIFIHYFSPIAITWKMKKSVIKQCLLDTSAQCQCDLENEVKVTKI